ncbi:AI-2E family transporter [Gimesia fumaroli]|uniref:AI-2 transport protein TqsA n=1 Tax=Gimesia fumaroli TaxID=2527976 RepID=A0A518I9U4_9PLAN|nr:AI-2E family transporter [Gimesia fumaroli]QDV49772.1 AI-2 transport protein TqsA [Gimesia fumaroli]
MSPSISSREKPLDDSQKQADDDVGSELDSEPKSDNIQTAADDCLPESGLSEKLTKHSHGRVSLAILATLAIVHALYFARSILIPIALAIVLFFLLAPVVRFLSKPKLISESIAAAAVVLVLSLTITFAGTFLADPVSDWLADAPETFRKAEQKLRFIIDPVDKIDKASERVSDIAAGGKRDDVVKVSVQQPPVTSYLLSSTVNFLAGATITVVLVYLLLAMGHRTLNSVVELMPTLKDKRGFVTMIRNVEQGISRYLLTITTINIVLGIVVGTVLGLLGLPDPFLLGIMVATLNFIPFVGAFVGASVTFLIGVVYLQTPVEAIIGPLIYLGINTLEGNVITPMILGRSLKLNPALVFICIIFWGWVWGIGGILLSVPLIGMIKISCDHFKFLQPVARLLSG